MKTLKQAIFNLLKNKYEQFGLEVEITKNENISFDVNISYHLTDKTTTAYYFTFCACRCLYKVSKNYIFEDQVCETQPLYQYDLDFINDIINIVKYNR